MHTEFTLREAVKSEWDKLWSKVTISNLQQCWEYGDAKGIERKCSVYRFIINDEQGKPVGLVQTLVKEWPVLGGIAGVNRGPVLLNEDPTDAMYEEKMLEALKAYLLTAKDRKWYFVSIAPEMFETENALNQLKSLNLRHRKKQTAWGSSLLSLTFSEDELLSNIDGKWRNMLRKAQKSGLVISHEQGRTDSFNDLLSNYDELQKQKKFMGVPKKLLCEMAATEGDAYSFDLYSAHKNEQVAGMVVSVSHGTTSTYLIGYTNESGRKTNANYLLLWQAILDARGAGKIYFDLGGFNENTPKGVKKFKSGLKGEIYSLVGNYVSFVF